ncbi:MAG: FAD-dependent oxidoreductase [Planctomycetaceae bacterium]
MRYDLIVIGSEPAGQTGAIAAANLGKSVALIESPPKSLGGVCRPTGTISSKAFREAVMMLTGSRHREVDPESFERRRKVPVKKLRRLANQVITRESNIIRQELEANGVEIYSGHARFVGTHEVEVLDSATEAPVLSADQILIAVGTRPARPAHIPFDGQVILDSEELLNLNRIPRSMLVIGGGVVGLEYAMLFALLGCQVTVTGSDERLLAFCDREIVNILAEQGRGLGQCFWLREKLRSVVRLNDESAAVTFEDGRQIMTESVLYAAERRGNTDSLNLEAAGFTADEQGRLWCNDFQQTWTKHIYGAGDVVGFPTLASDSMDQGRRAICHAFHQPLPATKRMPYGFDTTPEVAMIAT